MSALSSERQKLSDALAAQAEAESFLDEAHRAQRNATERWSAANAKVGALTREIEEAEQAPPEPSTDDLIAGLAKGGDVALLDKPTTTLDELREQLHAADAENAAWNAARLSCEEAVEARQRALDAARDRVEQAARAVAENELDVDALIAEAEKARQAVLTRDAALLTARRLLPDGSVKQRAIESHLRQVWLSPNTVEQAPGGEPYREWFAALLNGADTTLKAN